MTSSREETNAAPLDPCSNLDGSRFVSEEEKPCGPPIDGVPAPPCPSEIAFGDGQYEWRVTDMVFMGPYTCQERRVRSSESDDLDGTLSSDGRELVISGELYLRQ